MEKDITFDFDITTDIKEIEFPMPELSRILGIILDNAIEATNKTKNKYIRLEMRFDNRKCADIIKITNTYISDNPINIEDIYKKGVSSKDVKSGIGLWEVKKIVKKVYNSQIYASVDKNKFTQNIIIEKLD
ncbi:MAG: GHKL domain-containing protein [Clostridia bacterium]